MKWDRIKIILFRERQDYYCFWPKFHRSPSVAGTLFFDFFNRRIVFTTNNSL